MTTRVPRFLNTPKSEPGASELRWIAIVLMACAGLFTAACGHKATVKVPKPRAATPSPTAQTRPAQLPQSVPARVPAPSTEVPVPGPALPAPVPTMGMPGPSIRIGLTTSGREVRITAPGEFFLLEKIPEAARRMVRGELQIRVESGAEETRELYRVQVASLSRRDSAEMLGRKLTESFGLPVAVRENPDTGTYQIRIGAFPSRQEAQDFASGPLAEGGYAGAIVVRDGSQRANGGELKLSLRGPDLFRVSNAGFFFQPASANSFLRLDGKPYRGNLDLILNKNGLITVVNYLAVEEYLLGVVPAEMSPATYPEAAALEAQSIAARTYALKNLGRFTAEGFDLTADIRTQVYGGVAQEREGASKAVRGTSGIAIYYQGNLIDAMYTSTCGGRTEDFANVFDSAPVPYLRSVACTVENDGSTSGSETLIEGRHELDQTWFAEDGSNANRNIELAQLLGLSGRERLKWEDLGQSPAAGEIRRWVDQSLKVAGKEAGIEAAEQDVVTRAGFARYSAERLVGLTEIRRRITPADADYYLSNLRDGADAPPSARYAIALLLQTGLWRPYPDNSIRPREPIRRADALSLLVRWVESARPELLRSGTFEAPRAAGGDELNRAISVKWRNKMQQFFLVPDLRLFKLADGRSTAADSLRIIGNEKLRFHVSPDGKIDFMEVELNPTGASSDRFSPVASWQGTISRSAAAEKLRPLTGDIGEIMDLRPSRLGASGRAIQLEVVGSRRSVLVNGYKARNALGLRDTLFTIQRVHDPSGKVESFTFNGRGWGHGVGLCQVGAYGMARAGRTYEEILKTYYQGVELRKAY